MAAQSDAPPLTPAPTTVTAGQHSPRTELTLWEAASFLCARSTQQPEENKHTVFFFISRYSSLSFLLAPLTRSDLFPPALLLPTCVPGDHRHVAVGKLLPIDVTEYIRLRAVCKPWRVPTTNPTSLHPQFFPSDWLMLRPSEESEEGEDTARQFVNMHTDAALRVSGSHVLFAEGFSEQILFGVYGASPCLHGLHLGNGTCTRMIAAFSCHCALFWRIRMSFPYTLEERCTRII